MDKKGDSQVRIPAWTLAIILDGASLLAFASIKNFQQVKARYVSDAVEYALLVPEDMADLRLMRKHEVFLNL